MGHYATIRLHVKAGCDEEDRCRYGLAAAASSCSTLARLRIAWPSRAAVRVAACSASSMTPDQLRKLCVSEPKFRYITLTPSSCSFFAKARPELRRGS